MSVSLPDEHTDVAWAISSFVSNVQTLQCFWTRYTSLSCSPVAAPCIYLGCLKSCAVPQRGLIPLSFWSSSASSTISSKLAFVSAKVSPSGAISLPKTSSLSELHDGETALQIRSQGDFFSRRYSSMVVNLGKHVGLQHIPVMKAPILYS